MRTHRQPFFYVVVITLVSLATFGVSQATQLYGEEIKEWLYTSYAAHPLLFVGIAAVVFVILFIGAIWVYQQQQQPSDADPSTTPAVTRFHGVEKLPDDLWDDHADARGFIIEARTQAYTELQEGLLTPPKQTRWQALVYRLSFRRFCRPIQVPIAVITGIGGIGKTALGRRVCYDHAIKSMYHHGRFYFDAAGIYPQYAHNNTAQVLYRFLRGSGVSEQTLSGAFPPLMNVQAWLEQPKDKDDKDEEITESLRRLYYQILTRQNRLVILDNPPYTMDVSLFAPPLGNALLVITRPGLNLYAFTKGNHLHLRLGKFDDEAARRLLEREWPDGVSMVSQINRLSSGIPLVLIVLARTLNDEAENKGLAAARVLLTDLEQEHRKGGWLGARF